MLPVGFVEERNEWAHVNEHAFGPHLAGLAHGGSAGAAETVVRWRGAMSERAHCGSQKRTIGRRREAQSFLTPVALTTG